jgi:hypothetical protein
MIGQRLALSLAALAMGAAGCDGASGTLFEERDFVCAAGATQPCDTTTPRSSDDARTVEETADMTDTTLTYVVDFLSIPRAMSGQAPGFNLDGIDSGAGSTEPGVTCERYQPDYTSVFDNGHVGVDNALAGLLGSLQSFIPVANCPNGMQEGCLDAILAEQIADGSVLLLVELTGVNSLTYDSDIQMQLVLGGLPAGSGTACLVDADCTATGERCLGSAPTAATPEMGTCETAPTLEGATTTTGVHVGGRLAAGQTYTRVMPLGAPVAGDIFAGRVRATTASLTLEIDAGELVIPLEITSPEVRFNVSTTGLTDGAIGGVVQNQAILDAVEMFAPDFLEAAQGLIENAADVNPSATDVETCTALSVGIRFEGTTAL